MTNEYCIYEPLKFKCRLTFMTFGSFSNEFLLILHLHIYFIEHPPTFSILPCAWKADPHRGQPGLPCWLVSSWCQPVNDITQWSEEREERSMCFSPAPSCTHFQGYRCLKVPSSGTSSLTAVTLSFHFLIVNDFIVMLVSRCLITTPGFITVYIISNYLHVDIIL